jgi:hypothetical protein
VTHSPSQHGVPQYGTPQYGGPQFYAAPAHGGWGYGPTATAPHAPRLHGGSDALTKTLVALGGLYCALRWLWAVPASDEPSALEPSATSVAGALVGLLLLVGVLVGVFVVAGLWLQRARADAAALEPAAQPHGPAWVWFGAFLPVVSLFIPFRIVRAARATLLRRAGMTADGTVVTGWWAAWVGSLLASGFARTSESDALGLVGALLFTVAFALWTVIVRQMSEAQDRIRATSGQPRTY